MKIQVKNDTAKVLETLEEAKRRGLQAIGMTAEGYAKKILTETVYTGDKDWELTGRLRNSITWALSGEAPNIGEYATDNGADRGAYSGTAPNTHNVAVFIGTNVIYAQGIETGSHRKAGAVHFIKRAATEHNQEYKELVENSLKNRSASLRG